MLHAIIAERGWAPPIRCAISDRRSDGRRSPEEHLFALFGTSAQIIQWREKDLPAEEAREAIAQGVAWARQSGKLFVVNSLLETALELGADGIHLTSRQDPREARDFRATLQADSFLIGKSVHGLGEALKAEDRGADYLFLSPILAPFSKASARPPLGFGRLAEAIVRLHVPVFALGGMSPRYEGRLRRIGAVGFAGIGWSLEEAGPAGQV